MIEEKEVRIHMNKERILQHTVKQTIIDKRDKRESKSNWISMNMNTIKWHAGVNVLKK